MTTLTHHEARTYAHQTRRALEAAGITVSDTHIDTPDQAAEYGREYAYLTLTTGSRVVQGLIWSDWGGWAVSTHNDHHPVLPGHTHPDPQALAAAAAPLIRTLAR